MHALVRAPTGSTAQYFRCVRCSSLIQFPVPSPEQLQAYYETYIGHKTVMNPGYLDNAQREVLARERDLTFSEIGFPLERIASGTNVELGCANGHFLSWLLSKGSMSTLGLDISADLLSRIDLPNVNLKQGGLEQCADNSVDNLFMFNVLEHVPGIPELFTHMRRILRNNALVVIEVPVSGFVALSHGKKWRFLMGDEHLHIPSVKGLRMLCELYGLSIMGSTRFGSGFTMGSLPKGVKRAFDSVAKRASFGDRGCFLLRHGGIPQP